ncbi:MAG: glycosyltransferase family 2 protein [Kiritimatiellia bacterium]
MKTPAPLAPLPERPLLSIVVPSYNQGAFIRQTIESCLAQDYRPIEIVVVDGASTDDTVAVLRSFADRPEVRWVSEPDAGVADAVNKGLRRVRGEICGIQSSDDAYLPGAFAQAVAAFERHPAVALVYADAVKTDAAGREWARWRTGPFSIENFLSKQTVVLQPAAFFRRSAFWEAGGWSADFFNADTECWLRMVLRRPALKVDAFWGARRMHEAQRDTQRARIVASYARMTRDNPDLRNGPARWRRAARCGRLLHEARYAPALSPWKKKWLLLLAVLAWPPAWKSVDLPGHWVPGWSALRRFRADRNRRGGAENA